MYFKKITSMLLSMMLASSMAASISAATNYNDIDTITSHVKFKVPSTLTISRPTGEIGTNDAAFFIAGSSDPQKKLTVNGQTVTTRGVRGSFGVYVTIEQATNQYLFQQGDKSVTVIIRKGLTVNDVRITDVRRMAPDYNFAVAVGESALLSCEAPSGATVTATVNGQSIRLTQKAAASEGVPARFEAIYKPASVSQTTDLGPVTYTMTNKNKSSSQTSQGRLFAAGERLVVQVQNNAANIFDLEQHTKYIAEGRLGAVDYVTEIGASDYHLASGGWIPHSSVTPVAGNVAVKNKVSDAQYQLVDGGEVLTIKGSSHPLFRASQTSQSFTVQLMNTTGIKDIQPDISQSALYADVKISESNGATTLVFSLDGTQSLWGYDVSYKNGVTTIYSKYRPKLKSGNKPLSGIKVVLDPGHGGDDPGALGMPGLNGSDESVINYMTAVAVQKRLESLGAQVVLTRGENETRSLNERMDVTQRERADFFLAVHSNSIGFGASSLKAKGVETYYYDDISKKFATAVTNNISAYTGRTNRGTKFSNFRVTMNSFCPSALVELGFVTNPEEYDNLTTQKAIFEAANAIGDAVVSALS